MQASFDGAFPDIPLPNLGSGLSRIHVDATCLPASGGALRFPHARDLTRLFCTRLLPQGSPFGSTFGGYNSTTPWSRFRALVVTFLLFNSFNASSYYFRNSQCKFSVERFPFAVVWYDAAVTSMNFELYILLIGAPLALGLWAQFRVSSAFKTYKEIAAASGVTGADAARRILADAGIHDVRVEEINDMLGDHYDPSAKRLCLSTDVYNGDSIAAVGIAAHECGHALQHKLNYGPLNLRMQIVPATQFASQILPFVIMGGFFFHMTHLINLGIACYAILMVFQLITLPVEFDASNRAKAILQQMGIIRPGEEAAGVNAVLNAAALTYVAAFVAALGNLIYLFLARNHDER